MYPSQPRGCTAIPSPPEKVRPEDFRRFTVLGSTLFWTGGKTDLQGFTNTSNQKEVTTPAAARIKHRPGTNIGLLRLVSALVDFPAWMDLLATH